MGSVEEAGAPCEEAGAPCEEAGAPCEEAGAPCEDAECWPSLVESREVPSNAVVKPWTGSGAELPSEVRDPWPSVVDGMSDRGLGGGKRWW